MTLQHTGHHNSAAENEVFVIGAGPAGLTAAHELQSLGFRPIVIERHAQAGGIVESLQILLSSAKNSWAGNLKQAITTAHPLNLTRTTT